MRPVAPTINPPTHAYLEQARRLRRQYHKNPHTLHRRLKDLAQTQPSQPVTRPPSLSADSPEAHLFAAQVAAQLQNEKNVLRYSSRIKLLQQAHALGLRRFEANLIIAITEHRLKPVAPITPAKRTSYNRWTLPIAGALAVQTALVTAAYFLLRP